MDKGESYSFFILIRKSGPLHKAVFSEGVPTLQLETRDFSSYGLIFHFPLFPFCSLIPVTVPVFLDPR